MSMHDIALYTFPIILFYSKVSTVGMILQHSRQSLAIERVLTVSTHEAILSFCRSLSCNIAQYWIGTGRVESGEFGSIQCVERTCTRSR